MRPRPYDAGGMTRLISSGAEPATSSLDSSVSTTPPTQLAERSNGNRLRLTREPFCNRFTQPPPSDTLRTDVITQPIDNLTPRSRQADHSNFPSTGKVVNAHIRILVYNAAFAKGATAQCGATTDHEPRRTPGSRIWCQHSLSLFNQTGRCYYYRSKPIFPEKGVLRDCNPPLPPRHCVQCRREQ